MRRGGAGRLESFPSRSGMFLRGRAGGPVRPRQERALLIGDCSASRRALDFGTLAFFKLLYCIGSSSKCHIALDILRHKTREHMLLGANQGTGDCLVGMKAGREIVFRIIISFLTVFIF